MEGAPTWTPIAVIGLGVRRAPGAAGEEPQVSNPAALLAALRAGTWSVLPAQGDEISFREASEVAFDAVEDAGVPLERLRSRTVGVYASDAQGAPGELAEQVAQSLQLRGPLAGRGGSEGTAIYLACGALADGSCDKALAVGRSGSLCGAVLLERLDRALAQRHSVLAVLRATGPLLAGGPSSQAEGLKRVLTASGTAPADIGSVELQEPGEEPSHAAFYGRASPWLRVTPPSEGVVALIRTVLAVRNREIWLGSERLGWPLTRRAVAALTTSSGDGRMLHLIVAQADPDLPPSSLSDPPAVWIVPVSAYDEPALRSRAKDLVERLNQGANPVDVAYTAVHHRSHLPLRAVVIAPDVPQMKQALAALASGAPHPCLVQGSVSRDAPATARTAWLFSQAPTEWVGTGAELCRDEPAFRDAFDEACRQLSAQGCTLRGELFRASASGPEISLPATFALQVGLAAWLRSLGHEPDAVIGHGAGEVAATWACGSWKLSDAAGLVARSVSHKEGPVELPRNRRTPSVPCWSVPSEQSERLRERLVEARELGVDMVVELGPDAGLTEVAREIYGEPLEDGRGAAVRLLPAQGSELASIRRAAAELHVRGARIDWTQLVRMGTRVPLGSYPWSLGGSWALSRPK